MIVLTETIATMLIMPTEARHSQEIQSAERPHVASMWWA